MAPTTFEDWAKLAPGRGGPLQHTLFGAFLRRRLEGAVRRAPGRAEVVVTVRLAEVHWDQLRRLAARLAPAGQAPDVLDLAGEILEIAAAALDGLGPAPAAGEGPPS